MLIAHSSVTIVVIAAIAAALIPHHLDRRYWLHTGLIAYVALLMYALGNRSDPAIHQLLLERPTDMLAGSLIALCGTWLAFSFRKGSFE